MSYQNILNTHLLQTYGEFSGDVDTARIARKYAAFPNEAIYIVDCQNFRFFPLTSNFARITGIDRPHKNDMFVLCEHIHPQNLQAWLRYTKTVVDCGFDRDLPIIEEADFQTCIYRSHDDRVILKTTAVLHYDTAGTMRYTMGKLTDITGLVPFNHFGYKFTGPNRQHIYDYYRTSSGEDQMLSPREKEILRLIAEMYTSREIAAKLYISKHTVDQHRRNIIAKLEVSNAQEGVIKATGLGII